MTTVTPPPAPPQFAPPQPVAPPPAPRSGARVLAIVLAVIGAIVVLGTVLAAGLSVFAAATTRTTTQSVSAAGVSELDIDLSAGRLTIAYDDVDEATLEVSRSSGIGEWTLSRDGDALVVSTPRSFFGGWLFSGPGNAVLTLPEALESTSLGASFELSAGDLVASGTFSDLDIDVSAGSLRIEGTADTVDADVSAGSATIELSDVAEASFTVSAGTIQAELTGDAPDRIDLNVSAGSVRATLPDVAYDVRIDRTAGELHNSLETSSSSDRIIEGSVSAGDVTLRPGR